MSDPSNAANDEEKPSISRMWLVLVAISAATLVAAAVLLFVLRDSDDAEDPAMWLDIGWAIADGEAPAGTLNARLNPAVSGENSLELDLDPAEGSWLTSVRDVEVLLLPYRGDAEPIDLSLKLDDGDQKVRESIDLSDSDAWELRVTTSREGEPEVLAIYYLLTPDPNLHGNDAVALMDDDPAAVELYQRASQAVAEWHRVRYEQQLSDGSGLAVVSFRDINDGADGSTPGFRYFTPGGLEAHVIGTTAWARYPGEDWEVRTSNAMIPPSQWGGEFEGATGFQLGPISDSPNGPCRIVTFVVPGGERQAIAWYAWCIDEETGTLYRDSMTARTHYMITEFSSFNEEIVIAPPEGAPMPPATPAATDAQPSPEAT